MRQNILVQSRNPEKIFWFGHLIRFWEVDQTEKFSAPPPPTLHGHIGHIRYLRAYL